MNAASGHETPPPGCPAHRPASPAADAPVPLYGPDFAANPESFYDLLRQYGPAAPVELAPGVRATLVTDYNAALHVLQNPEKFAKDARRWRDLAAGRVPADSPAVPMLAYRPNALFTDGAEHLRLRQAVTESLGRVDTHRLSRHVERVSAYLVGQFASRGSVDLLHDYAKPLPLLVFNEIFGCPAQIGDRLIYAISRMFDGIDPENANRELTESLQELVLLKRSQPAADVTTWLMQHPAGLTDEEMVHQLVMLMSAGTEPQRNLIANGLCLTLSDTRFASGQYGGALLVEDALDEVLWNSPPMANYAPHYPVRDTDLFGVPLRAGDLVLVSFAAANTDPSLPSSRQVLSKRAHLAWSAGPHACPAKEPAQLVAIVAVEKLLNQLPDIELAVPVSELRWRPGPFHRALASLPARFTPVRRSPVPLGTAADGAPAAGAAQPSGVRGEPAGRPAKGTWWSSFLTWWRV